MTVRNKQLRPVLQLQIRFQLLLCIHWDALPGVALSVLYQALLLWDVTVHLKSAQNDFELDGFLAGHPHGRGVVRSRESDIETHGLVRYDVNGRRHWLLDDVERFLRNAGGCGVGILLALALGEQDGVVTKTVVYQRLRLSRPRRIAAPKLRLVGLIIGVLRRLHLSGVPAVEEVGAVLKLARLDHPFHRVMALEEARRVVFHELDLPGGAGVVGLPEHQDAGIIGNDVGVFGNVEAGDGRGVFLASADYHAGLCGSGAAAGNAGEEADVVPVRVVPGQ